MAAPSHRGRFELIPGGFSSSLPLLVWRQVSQSTISSTFTPQLR